MLVIVSLVMLEVLLTAVFESEANQTRVWVLIFASYLFIRNQTKSVINQVKSTRTNHVSMVAMVRHGRAPHDGAANGSISASVILVTSSLKSTNVDVRMHVHASMEPVGFSTHQYGETKPIWPFPCAPTRFGLGRCLIADLADPHPHRGLSLFR